MHALNPSGQSFPTSGPLVGSDAQGAFWGGSGTATFLQGPLGAAPSCSQLWVLVWFPSLVFSIPSTLANHPKNRATHHPPSPLCHPSQLPRAQGCANVSRSVCLPPQPSPHSSGMNHLHPHTGVSCAPSCWPFFCSAWLPQQVVKGPAKPPHTQL